MGFSAPPHARRQAAQPTLSLCMIVKNEAENLERCLETARPHVEEIVIVDTGSTDGTQAIARRYADVFDQIEWPDSFSKARNHSFDLSSGDYNIWLDGDDCMPDPKDWQKVRAVLDEKKVAGVFLLQADSLPGQQVIERTVNPMCRVVLNRPEIRFQGKVHNQIDADLKAYMEDRNLQVAQVPAVFHHIGYHLTPDEKKEKYGVRIPLLLHEVEHAKTPMMKAYYTYQLAVGYSMTGEKERALQTLRALTFDDLVGSNQLYARVLAANLGQASGAHGWALRHAEWLRDAYPHEPIGHCLSASVHVQQGKLKTAVGLLGHTLNLVADAKPQTRYRLNQEYLYFLLGKVAAYGKRWERAKFFLSKSLEGEDNPEAQALLVQVKQMLQNAQPETV